MVAAMVSIAAMPLEKDIKPLSGKKLIEAGRIQGLMAKQKEFNLQKKLQQNSDTLEASIAAGKIVYLQNCVSCHLPTGTGTGTMNPTLVKTAHVQGDKKWLIEMMLKGMKQQEIDGVKYTNAMPPFAFLNDKQIADVLTFVRNSFGNKAAAVTPDEVKAVRANN